MRRGAPLLSRIVRTAAFAGFLVPQGEGTQRRDARGRATQAAVAEEERSFTAISHHPTPSRRERGERDARVAGRIRKHEVHRGRLLDLVENTYGGHCLSSIRAVARSRCGARVILALVLAALMAPVAAVDAAVPAVAAWWPETLLGVALGAALVALWLLRRRLQRSEASLALAETEWVQALDFAEDAMYLIDLDDRLVRGNQAFYRFLGRRPEEVIGERVMRLMHGADEDQPCPVCQARLDRRDAVFVKEAGDPVNRLKRPMEVVVKTIRGADGEPIGVLQVLRDLSRQRLAEQAIRESEERYRILSQAAFDGIAIHDGGKVVAFNPTLATMLGYTEKEVVGTSLLDYLNESAHALVSERFRNRITDPINLYLRRKDGSVLAAEVRARDLPFQGRLQRVVAVRDLRELEQARHELFAEKERLRVTLESIGEGVIVTDIAGRVQYLNPVAEAMLAISHGEAAGRPLGEFCRILDENGGAAADLVQSCLEQDAVTQSPHGCVLWRPDGREFAIEHSAGPIRDRTGQVTGVVLALRDVTEMRRLSRQLRHQASHDPLTGLINRSEFEQRLEQALASARDEAKEHALCYIDLDQFKMVNDTCGHAAGDQLLRQVAALVAARVRESDTVARLGGDEFGVLLTGCGLAEARKVADTLRQTIADFRFVWRDRSFDVGSSIGIAPLRAHSGSLADAMSTADAACYVAKDLGRNRIHVYEPDDAALARHHGQMVWAQRLSAAIKAGRLRLYSQPIVALGEGAAGPAWHEILVRMLDEDGQVVPPMAFIPAAERYNLMPVVDRWVVTATLAWMRGQGTSGRSPACAINLSGRSIGDDQFQQFVNSEIRASDVDPARVTFEITETAAIANFAQAQQFIVALKRLGCGIALDDFGSGLSSFAYLKHLSVDYLKIDGEFVRDMAGDPIDHAMVAAINQLGHVMGIKTIAEYVESEAVLARLREVGVDYAQGYALHRPAPL